MEYMRPCYYDLTFVPNPWKYSHVHTSLVLPSSRSLHLLHTLQVTSLYIGFCSKRMNYSRTIDKGSEWKKKPTHSRILCIL